MKHPRWTRERPNVSNPRVEWTADRAAVNMLLEIFGYPSISISKPPPRRPHEKIFKDDNGTDTDDA